MFDFAAALRPVLPPDAAAWLEQASASAEQLPVLLPQLARRIGRKPLVETETRIEHEGCTSTSRPGVLVTRRRLS
jgi:hypothetical protein